MQAQSSRQPCLSVASGIIGSAEKYVMEQVAKMACFSYLINPQLTMNPLLVEKHFSRKHGPNAYYGQKK